jgi:hypothetical protein
MKAMQARAVGAIVVLGIVLIAMPAYAQMGGGGRSRGSGAAPQQGPSEKQKKMAAEEKAAKSAMDKVPDSKEKYDPWKISR